MQRKQIYTHTQGSRDNMSIILLTFDGAPKISEDAKAKEEELNQRLEARVKGLIIFLSYYLNAEVIAHKF